MLRALVISLLILCSLAATLPLADSFAGGTQASAAAQKRRYRRHSRAWWRRHRAALRRRRAAAAQRARLRTLNAQGHLPGAKVSPVATAAAAHALLTPALAPLALPDFSAQPTPLMPALAMKAAAPMLPDIAAPEPPRKVTAPQWPRAWHNLSANAAGELRFSVRGMDVRNTGLVTWTRVAAANAAPDANKLAKGKTLSGVSFTELRRKVISKMLTEGGWVVNDMERELGGQRTFIVVAESAQADGAHTSWVFYFTEFNGQIYGLTTSARVNDAPALAADAEQFVTALNTRARAAFVNASTATLTR